MYAVMSCKYNIYLHIKFFVFNIIWLYIVCTVLLNIISRDKYKKWPRYISFRWITYVFLTSMKFNCPPMVRCFTLETPSSRISITFYFIIVYSIEFTFCSYQYKLWIIPIKKCMFCIEKSIYICINSKEL